MLKYTEDRRTIAFVLFSFAVQATGLLLLPQNWALMVLLCIAISQTSFVCAVISHNTMHAPMFKNKAANRVVQYFLSVATGDPVSSFVPGHNLGHHTHLQQAKDTMRTTKMRFRWNFLNQFLFMFSIGGSLVAHTYRYVWHMRHRRAKWFRQFVLELIVVLSAYAAVIAFFGVVPFLLYVFIPHNYASWGIIGINFVQHDGCDAEHPANHSRNFTGKLVNWWTFNNGYHGMHHMQPGLHWSRLPEAHAEKLSPSVHPNLEQKSLIAYCWKAYGWPGKRVDYLGQPVVLPSPIEDESWVPAEHDIRSVSLGAEAA